MKLSARAASAFFAALVVSFATTPAAAQDGKVSLFAGYAFMKTDDGNLNGLRLSPAWKLNSFASAVADVSAEKGTLSGASNTLYTYMGGVRLHRGIGGLNLFVHALAGGVRTSASVSPFSGVTVSVSESHLAYDGGGGLDFHFKGSIRFRVGADYLRRKVDVGAGKSTNVSDIRATAGFVF